MHETRSRPPQHPFGPRRHTRRANAAQANAAQAGDAQADDRWAVAPGAGLAAPGAVVILTALELEYSSVRGHLVGLRTVAHRAGTLFEIGYLPGCPRPIVVAVHGEGITTAAIMSERAIATFQPDAVFFVGIAGGLQCDLWPGDVVVATRVYSFQGGKEYPDGFHIRPRAWDAPHRLEQRARQVARSGAWARLLPVATEAPPKVHFRPIVAGDVVFGYRSGPQRQLVSRYYDDSAAVDMEGAGVARAAHLNEAPTLIIRGLSDLADEDKGMMDSLGWQRTAAAHAAAFALQLIASIPVDGAPSD